MSRMLRELLEEEHMKGYAEGYAQGRAQRSVLDAFEARFTVVPEQVTLRVLSTEDLRLLKFWHKAVIRTAHSGTLRTESRESQEPSLYVGWVLVFRQRNESAIPASQGRGVRTAPRTPRGSETGRR